MVNINEIISNILNKTTQIINDMGTYLLLASLLLAIILFILFLVQRARAKKSIRREELLNTMINSFDPPNGMEANLQAFLALLGTIVNARDYAFYLYDNKSNQYLLKTLRHLDDEKGKIVPSYSGLLPFKKDKYNPPLSVSYESADGKVEKVKDGEIPVLVVAVKGGKGLVRMSPVYKVSSKAIDMLNILKEKFQPLLDGMVEADYFKSQAKTVISSGKGVQNISSIFVDYRGMVKIIIGFSMRTLGASYGFFAKEDKNFYNIEVSEGLDGDYESYLREDRDTLFLFDRLLGENEYYVLKKGDREFLNIQPYMVAEGVETIILVRVILGNKRGITVFMDRRGSEIKSVKDYQITALLILSKRIGDIIDNYIKFKMLSKSYVDMLKFLANMLDNLNPYTVGYSDLMSRFSVIIAKEMNLSREEIRDISLAAYLSNIGVLGLSEDFFHKKGKYSEIEYETMKLHTEVGASIIQATIANERVADYIRYHHERVDGHGYLAGLKKDEIPLGSRIIAVVQTFLAKLMGREYREPLPFKDALSMLRSSSGTQLDGEIVEILIGWFDKKQAECLGSNTSLGACWEMRCIPENICASCPNYNNDSINCWDSPENNCNGHGNNCSTCYIYTEYLYRKEKYNGRFTAR